MTTAVILAGGRGERMGGNKPLHAYGDSTLIQQVAARLKRQADSICINAGERSHPLAADLAALGLTMVYDVPAHAEMGPLSGVLSALYLAEERGETAVVTVPCDMPHLPLDLVSRLLEAPATDVVYFSGARDYPLCALWRASLAVQLERALDEARPLGGLPVMRFLDSVQVCKIAVSDDAAFANINQTELKQT